MFSQRRSSFNRLYKSYPLLKILDVYNKESFIRAYVLDNIFVCIFMYILFYFAIWYAHKVIKRIENKNREMLEAVQKNRARLDDIIALKNKRAEYEEIVIKAKGDQNIKTKQLDLEMRRLSSELVSTVSKLNELEKFIMKWKFWKSCNDRPSKKSAIFESEPPEGCENSEIALENIKILEPSFPPPMPPEPPPRKFGVFARPPIAATGVTNASTKIGFKQ